MNNEEKKSYISRFGRKDNTYIKDLPRKLYKYRPFDQYSLDMLENKYLYLCPAKDLDDETECNVSLNYNDLVNVDNGTLNINIINAILEFMRSFTTKEIYEKVKSIIYSTVDSKGEINRNLLLNAYFDLQNYYSDEVIVPFINYFANIPDMVNNEKTRKIIEESISTAYQAKDKLGICSLAESDSNEYMWENYANKNEGYCVEYDLKNYKYIKDIFPVIYEDERETNVLKQLMLSIVGQYILVLSSGEAQPDISQYFSLFTTKYKKWEYQNEWRIIGDAGEKIDAPEITKIILGKNINTEDKNKIKDFCIKNQIEIEIRK